MEYFNIEEMNIVNLVNTNKTFTDLVHMQSIPSVCPDAPKKNKENMTVTHTNTHTNTTIPAVVRQLF
jgi:hypothetical protein